ncbi:MAG: DNA-processing protein DprA [Lachnospiraceae bacterium]|nr:DNA-processing protein DprA [Lachnospiraceae bacterium]
MKDELKYIYWLNSVEGIGFKSMMVLKKYGGSASNIYNMTENDLRWFLGKRQLTEMVNSRNVWDIDGEFEKLMQNKISFYPYGFAGYPEKLNGLAAPPAALFVKGELPRPDTPAVAVIGTRKNSGYGSAMAKELGVKLAESGISVVSGMARGIDGIGQRAVCEAGGKTFAVLGCGADVVYPPENRRLYEQIIRQGGIISEYSPGTRPKAGLFPARNRIISGLSDVIVVIEAKEKSGTMITVDMALEQGREVYAMPGRLVDGLSCGCNRLIKQGAGLIVSIEEFIEEILATFKEKLTREIIDIKKQPAQTVKEKANIEKTLSLTAEEKQIYSCLDYIPRSLEQLSVSNPTISYENLLKILITFCLKGIASQMGAGYYCLK